MTTTTRGANMTTLTEFLAARLDEDEAVARDALHPTDLYDSAAEAVYERAANEGAPLRGLRHVNRWRPARVLAEVEAKRRVLDLLTDDKYGRAVPISDGARQVLAALALPYADHPDCDPDWTS